MTSFGDIVGHRDRWQCLLRSACCLAVTLVLSVAMSAARADVFGFIDGNGTVHVSTEKLDDRYQLFTRGDVTFDSDKVAHGLSATTVRPDRASPLVQAVLQHPNLKKYDAVVYQSAAEFAVSPALIKAIMAVESGFNPTAVSSKGAIGLMQIMPETAERYGLQGDRRKTLRQKLTDPTTNIRLAARYLHDLQALFPTRPDLAIASYNAGERAVQKYNNQIPPYPETRNYVQLVAKFFQLYQPGGDIGNTGNTTNTGDIGNTGYKPRRIEVILPARHSLLPTAGFE